VVGTRRVPTRSPLSLTPWAEPGVIARTWYFVVMACTVATLAKSARMDNMCVARFITAFRVRVRAALVVASTSAVRFLVVGQDSFSHSDVYASEDHQRIVLLLPNVERRKWSELQYGICGKLGTTLLQGGQLLLLIVSHPVCLPWIDHQRGKPTNCSFVSTKRRPAARPTSCISLT
jgi:hypothetical protein